MEFIDGRYSIGMLVFSIVFVNYCPSKLLSGWLSLSFPLPCLKKYTRKQCKGGGGVWGHRRGGGLRQIKHLPESPFTGQFFKITTFYQSNLFTVLGLNSNE